MGKAGVLLNVWFGFSFKHVNLETAHESLFTLKSGKLRPFNKGIDFCDMH
jgi:hypothetical protein